MAELYERIEKMCKDRGVTITEMCKQSGASRGSLTDLKMGRSAGLSLETLEKLMKYFDFSLPELMGTETKKAAPDESRAEHELLEIFKQLDEEGKHLALMMLKALLTEHAKKNHTAIVNEVTA